MFHTKGWTGPHFYQGLTPGLHTEIHVRRCRLCVCRYKFTNRHVGGASSKGLLSLTFVVLCGSLNLMTATQGTHHDNRAFYDRISSAYDLLSDASERAARLRGLQLLNAQPGERVLEIGFGTGNELVDLAGKVGGTGKVVGVDISSGMKSVAAHKLAKAGLTDAVELLLADARTLPFPDDSFDAAYSSFTLELFSEEDIPVVLSEIKRVLKSGGRLGVVSMATVNTGEHASALEKAYIWMHRHFPHIVDCRPISVAAVLQSAGFNVTASESLDIWTLPVTAAVAKISSGKRTQDHL